MDKMFQSLIIKSGKKLGYEWKFVDIKYKKARKLITNKFNTYFNFATDGINVPVT